MIDRISQSQVKIQRQFIEGAEDRSLNRISLEEYERRQLWLFLDLMFLPIKDDTGMPDGYIQVERSEVPELFEMREMVRRIRNTDVMIAKNVADYREFIFTVSQRFPDAAILENADKTVVCFVDEEGRVLASRRLSTIGNF